MAQSTTTIESVWAAKGNQPDNAIVATADGKYPALDGSLITNVGDLLATNNLSELTATASVARTNLELGATDTVEFGGFVPPAGTTAEIDAVTTASVGSVMIDTNKSRNVRFVSASNYEEIGNVAFQNEIHISKDGTDTRTGLSPFDVQNPFLTFAAAVAEATDGDVITVHAGDYSAEGAVTVSADLNFNFLSGSIGPASLSQTGAGKTLKAFGEGSMGGILSTNGFSEISCNVLGLVQLQSSAKFSNCTIEGAGSPHVINLSPNSTGHIFEFRNCRIKATATDAGCIGISDFTFVSGSTYIVENCILEADGTGSTVQSAVGGSPTESIVVLNTFGNNAAANVTQQVETITVNSLITA